MAAAAVAACLALTAGIATAATWAKADPEVADKGAIDNQPLSGRALAQARLVERLEPVVAAVQARGRADDAFAGVRLDLANRGVEVFRRSGVTREVPSYGADVPSDLNLRITDAVLTQTETAALHLLVKQRAGWLASYGVTLEHWGRDTLGGPLVIGYSGTAPPADGLLEPFELYGENTVVFKSSSAEDLARPVM